MGARFLVSRLSSLGDVACTLPVAAALKAGFPDCHITWIVDPRFAGVVDCCTNVDEVVRVKPGFNPSSWPKLDGEFDAALDMQGLFKSAVPVWRAKAREKVGYHWQREGSWMFSSRVLPDPSSFHIVDQYVDVARAVGGNMDRAEFGLEPKPDDIESVKGKLAESGVPGPFVVVNPGAAWVTKRWSPESFAAVADALSEKGFATVLIGANAQVDHDVAAAVSSLARSTPISMVGKTNIRELIALLSLGKAHLGGDTGSTHIAAGLGIPAIGLYSITRPQRSCPYGQVDRCHYDPDGLDRIQPNGVIDSILEAVS